MAVCLALVSSSCSHDSFIVVRLYSGDAPFTDVAHVVVDVADADGNPSAKLRYDTAAKPISFDTNSSKSLSISFTPSRSGVVTVAVAVFGSSNECLGSGTAMPSPPIKKGDVSTVTVILHHTSSCGAADGGSGTDANVTFPGCDPATLGSCAANQTCFVDCSTSRGMCIAAGARGPGEPCVMNSDCMPGTQCFNYSDLPGCQPGTRVCLKFCNGDSQCSGAAAGSGGAGGARGSGGAGGAGTGGAGGRAATGGGGATGSGGSGGSGGTTPAAGAVVSACRNPVMCTPTVTTSYRTCSLACDPRGQANVGCPAGLLCFLYRDPAGGEAAPDCGCREPSRTKTDGMDCSSSVDCAPGYVCNMMGATRTCRKLCKMTSPADCSAPQTCNTLQDNSIFGVCIGAGGLDGGGTGS